MEGGRNEVEFDEFEKLLCEIPTATSGNLISENSGSNMVLLDDYNSFPICLNSCRGPSIEKKNRSLNEEKLLVNKIQQSPIKMSQSGEMFSPNDQSLTSVLENLRFTNGLPAEDVNPSLSNYVVSPKYPIFLDNHYTNNSKRSTLNMDSHVMVVSNNVPFSFDGLDMSKLTQENPDASRHNAIEPKIGQVCHFQQFESFPTVQFFPNVPLGAEYPVLSNQQQFLMDAQPPLPHVQPQQLNQPLIYWRNLEYEYYRMLQQDLYLQQLHDQRLDIQQSQSNRNIAAARVMSLNMGQSCREMPISHQLEQSKQDTVWNNCAFTRRFNHSNLALSAEYKAIEGLGKVAKHTYPEQILTRLHGLNTHRNLNFGSGGGNGSPGNISHNGKVLSNGLKSTDVLDLSQKTQYVESVAGQILLMAKDQHGCRFLQRKFAEGNTKDVELIFEQIVDHIVELMTDPFGNYLVQKLLEVCDENQKMQILYTITKKSGELVRISCNMHGTRAVQKVIEIIKTPDQFSMVVSSLKPGIVTLMKDMNGNHVAQRCLQYLSPENNEFLFEAAITNCVELAVDRYGCCVLQKCLNYSDGEQRRRLVQEITWNSLILSQDPFGNYVVQFVFALRLSWATKNILEQLVGNYGDLSMQKYSSNVIEKCLINSGEEDGTRIIQELINSPQLDQIMQDPYGNYVIQEALKQSKGSIHAALLEAIRPHVPVLRTSPYGKKILSSNRLKK